jgi:hypothetical protein
MDLTPKASNNRKLEGDIDDITFWNGQPDWHLALQVVRGAVMTRGGKGESR